jgi:hypothetical protein
MKYVDVCKKKKCGSYDKKSPSGCSFYKPFAGLPANINPDCEPRPRIKPYRRKLSIKRILKGLFHECVCSSWSLSNGISLDFVYTGKCDICGKPMEKTIFTT